MSTFDDAVDALEPPLRAAFDALSLDEQHQYRTEIHPSHLELYLRLASLEWSGEALSDRLSEAVAILSQHTQPGGSNDPKEGYAAAPWLWLIAQLREKSPGTAITVSRTWYRHLAATDRANGTLSPNRAVAAYAAGMMEFTRNNVATGRRWLHIAHVEDSRSGHRGAARTLLIEGLGEDQKHLNSLAELVASESAGQPDFRSSAEYLLTRWYLSLDKRDSDLALDSEFEVDAWLLAEMLKKLAAPRDTAKQTGDALEILAAFFCSHITGCYP